MTAKDARHRDDWKDDPENPLVPFRMSDRIAIYGLQVKVNTMLVLVLLVAGLMGAGMAFKFL